MEPIANKLPPQSEEAELSVLGCLMLDKDAIIQVADMLKPKDFYKPDNQAVFEAMLDLYEKRQPIDLLSLGNRLKEKKQLKNIGGNAYLTTLVNSVPTSAHVKSYADIVQRKSTLRRLIGSAADITQLAYQEQDDIDEILDAAEQKIFGVSQKHIRQDFAALKPMLGQAFERLDELHKSDDKLRGLETGFYDLDNKLAGLQKSDLIIIAARPSLGKTTLALDIARHVATHHKVPVGIFSLEMSKDQLVDRLLCSQGHVDLWKYRTGKLRAEGEDNDFARVNEAISQLSEAPIFIDDSSATNVMQMRTMARRLQADKKLGLLVIDYLQLMDGQGESRVQEISTISRSLKLLARELNIPIIALSQLSRAVEQRPDQIPKLSDLRESGCLTGDTLITKANTGERIAIQDLIKKNIFITSVSNNYKLKKDKAIKIFNSGRKTVYKLKTQSGREIKASANHPFLKLEGWTRLDKLNQGDFIAIPREILVSSPKNNLKNQELILLAHLLGDGCILRNQPFHYTSADKINITTVKKTAQNLFNIKPRIVKQKNWYHIYLPSPYHLTHKKHHPITNWFNKLEINLVRSWEKKAPGAIFQCDKNKIALFLKHLWSTDGNLSWKKLSGRKLSCSIYYATSSKILAEQVQHLLLRLEIFSCLKKRKSKKNYRSMYHVLVQGSIEQLKFLNQIGINGERRKLVSKMRKALQKINSNPNNDIIPKQAWQLIIKPIKEKLNLGWRDICKMLNASYCGSALFKSGLSRQRMMRLYKALKAPILKQVADSDVYWDKIVKIKKIGMQKVYDMTIENNHNFIANDIIVHNSIEQDADVVLFIYRKDRVNPRCEEKNIADILISKHRNGPIGQIKLFFNEDFVSFQSLQKTGQN